MTRKNWAFIGSAFLLLSLPAVIIARQESAATEKQTTDKQTNEKKPAQSLKVDVDLVLVNATVTDPLNRYVTSLEASHFQITEDKVEQKIEYFNAEEVPISIGIIFDVSGS